MDIGNQQRVIIVELEETEVKVPDLEPAAALSVLEEADLVGDWPLPLDINVEHAPAN